METNKDNFNLTMEIATIKLKLKDINSLKKGKIIGFEFNKKNPIEIKIDNNLIGYGEFKMNKEVVEVKIIEII